MNIDDYDHLTVEGLLAYANPTHGYPEGAVLSAVFQPERTDDLRGGAEDLIGQRMRFQVEGNIAVMLSSVYDEYGFWWVPMEDLQGIEVVENPAPMHFGNREFHWCTDDCPAYLREVSDGS